MVFFHVPRPYYLVIEKQFDLMNIKQDFETCKNKTSGKLLQTYRLQKT